MDDPYHAIVVGGGHNGLVAGSYLARSGARTVVLEARPKVGGAVDTSAPFPEHPDIRVSTYSYVMSLMPAFIVDQLELAKHGYRVTPFGPYYQAFPDGRSIAIHGDDPKRTARVGEPVLDEGRRDPARIRGLDPRDHGGHRSVAASGAAERRVPVARGPTRAVVGCVVDAQAGRARGRGRDAPVHDEPLRSARPVVRVRADEDDHDGRRPDRPVVWTRRAGHRLRPAAPRDRERGRLEPHGQLGLPHRRYGGGGRCDPRLGAGGGVRDPYRRAGRANPGSRRPGGRCRARVGRGAPRPNRRELRTSKDRVPSTARSRRAAGGVRGRHRSVAIALGRREDQRGDKRAAGLRGGPRDRPAGPPHGLG
jgi:NAD(P)-binding Rossmann-like domain